MDDRLAVARLEELGLNGREARLYLALLKVPEATAAQLHRISGVPRTKTYESLERMVSRGFCQERVEGRRRFFRATSPPAALTMLRRGWETEYEERNQIADETFEELGKLHRLSFEKDPSLEAIEVLRSKEQNTQTFLRLMHGTQREVLSFTRSPYSAATEQIRAEVKRAQHEAFNRGVQIHTIYMIEQQDWGWLESFIDELLKAGEIVRLTDELPMKMFVFDREKVLIALPSVPDLTGSDFTMILIEDPGFTKASVSLFELYWDRALPPEEWVKNNGRNRAVTTTEGE